MRKTTIFGILVLLAVLAMPIASAHVTVHFDPQDSSVPNGYCNTTHVRMMLNITGSDDVMFGNIGIKSNATCIDFTDAVFGSQINTGASYWHNESTPNPCGDVVGNDGYEWILFRFYSAQSNTDIEICNFTIHCNCSTCGYCTSPLNFSCGATGCASCPFSIADSTPAELHPHNTTLENGTIACGVEPGADIVATLIDPKYIFADLNNSLMANVTNQGVAASGPFDVCVDVTDEFGAPLYSNTVSCGSLNAGESATDECGHDRLHLGCWTPDTLENITITVTVDCDGDVDEGAGEGNNVYSEYRNTTGDCDVDTMLPDTCYGYRGQNPMGPPDEYSGNGTVIYTYGNSTSNGHIAEFVIGAGGDTNQKYGTTADIPAGATIKTATLYVYYDWRYTVTGPNPGLDPNPDFNMSFDSHLLGNADAYYTDMKGWAASQYQYGTMVYNVTDYVIAKGNGTYLAQRLNYASGKGYDRAIALMIAYDDGSGSTYSIVHGYDRLATLYWQTSADRYQYWLCEPATTTATLSDIDPTTIADAYLFTVAIDTTDGTGEESQKIDDCGWYEGAWSKHLGSYLSFNRTNVSKSCLTPAGTDETISFSEGWLCSGNGFGIVFACMQTSGGATQIAIDQPEFVDPQSQFTINITVDPQGNEVSAVQYDLYYNTSVVWAEWANPGTFLNRSGPTDVTVLSIDNLWDVAGHTGKITYAETLLGSGGTLPSVNTPGVLTTIHFSAIGVRGSYTQMDLDDVMMSNPDKLSIDVDITDCGVTIYNNEDPVANGSSMYRFSNVASKFQCFAVLCPCLSTAGDDAWWGNNITYIRWDFGDGQYGTSEGVDPCEVKMHEYTTWNWNGTGYDPFTAYLTVRDDGEPQLSNTTEVYVQVYIAGDTNGDGVVDIFDAACVGKHWGQEAGNPAGDNCTYYWDIKQADEADLNNDMDVDTIDAMIVGTNWNHLAYPPYYKE